MRCKTPNAFTPIKNLVPYVKQYHAYAPDNVIEVQIQKAAISFSRYTGLIRRTFTLSQQAGVEEFYLDPECDLQFWMVNCITVDGCRVRRIEKDGPGACGYFFEPCHTLIIRPPSRTDKENNVELEATMIVSPDACNIPSMFFDKWRDTIVYGAAAGLHRLPHLEGSNLSLSREYEAMYREDRARALGARLRGHSMERPTVNVPRMI